MLRVMQTNSPLYEVAGWKRLRAALGLRQREMAEIMGVSVSAVKRLEAGVRQRPHRATLILLRAWVESEEGNRRLRLANYPLERLAETW